MAQERTSISYSLSGLPAREQLVFKSLMRLLAPRLKHDWAYLLEGELLVQGDPFTAPEHAFNDPPALTQNSLISLKVGALQANGLYYLRLPIQANIMEERLNALGIEVVAKRVSAARSVAHAASQSGPISIPQALARQIAPELAFAGELSLKRWPSQQLMRSAAHIRMATVLLRRRTSLPDLMALSGQSAVVCQHFLRELKAADLLLVREPVSSSAGGLAAPPHSSPHSPPNSASHASAKSRPSEQAGLLSRIRRRLGL